MHELTIAEALIEEAERAAEDVGQAGRIARLDVVVGRLSGVCSESLRFAFEQISPGTRTEGAELHITEPKAVCLCHDCDASQETDELVGSCPTCGSGNILIEGSRELLLQSLEVED